MTIQHHDDNRPAPLHDGQIRVLVASPDRDLRRRLVDALERCGHLCETAAGGDGVRRTLAGRDVEIVLLDERLADGPGLDVAPRIAESGAGIVVLASAATADLAVEAMRAGALDLLPREVVQDELVRRVLDAARRLRASGSRSDRVHRLSELCRELNSARRQMGDQVSTLCRDLTEAYDSLSDQLDRVAAASEFAGVIGQELDIEELLRIAMEHVLSKSGPTNAAVFLPDTGGDFTLGAYVNYDRSSENAEMMFDHLASVVAPRFEHARSAVTMRDGVERDDLLGDDAHWLEGCAVLAVPCVHDEECLAVMTLFRDEQTPFDERLGPTLDAVAHAFAKQLGRVIRVHHRHLPRDQWGSLDGPDSDDLGLAA